jgi:RNA recognition motif-containing protein
MFASFPALKVRRPEVAKKLYVGNLAYAVTDQDLKDLFSESGTVESVAVISDKFSGQSKGFGFVEMADATGAEAAIKTLDGTEFKGRNLRSMKPSRVKAEAAVAREGAAEGVDGVEIVAVVADVAIAGSRKRSNRNEP